MKATLLRDLIKQFEHLYPKETAASWDPIGLHYGPRNQKVRRALVTQDLTGSGLELARKKKCDLIITHHPPVFKGVTHLKEGSLLEQCIEHRIALYSLHTNFDSSGLGFIKGLSKALEFDPKGRLFDEESKKLLKLVVYVPESHLEIVKNALFEKGAGRIGQYDSCSFVSKGRGGFRASENSTPFIGSKGKSHELEEYRLEVILPQNLKHRVVQALLKSHPYEEPAYDLYRVHQELSQLGVVKGLGYGVWGEMYQSQHLKQLLPKICREFKVDVLSVFEAVTTQKRVKQMAYSPGKGSSFVASVQNLKCDLYVTGELDYHQARELSQRGIHVVLLGHTQSECYFVSEVGQNLKSLGVQVIKHHSPVQKFYA